VLSRAPGPWRLEADDAMGVGIDNAILLVLAIACSVVLAVALWIRSIRESRRQRSDASAVTRTR
jgi:hypothetical protein